MSELMSQKQRYTVFIVFLLIYIAMGIFNIATHRPWIIDNCVAVGFLLFMFLASRWLLLGLFEFLMFNIALLIHNMGTFGWYEWTYGFVAYDNFVHLFGAFVAAWIFFNIISERLHIRRHRHIRHTVVDDHKLIMIFLVLASVAMGGVVVEIIEFFGEMYLGPSFGLLATGAIGAENVGSLGAQYVDTMQDIMVNIVGATIGVIVFYFTRYKNKFLL